MSSFKFIIIVIFTIRAVTLLLLLLLLADPITSGNKNYYLLLVIRIIIFISSLLTLYPLLGHFWPIHREAAENIRSKGFKSSNRKFCSTLHGLSTSKKIFFFNALIPRYTIHNIDDFEKIEKNRIFSSNPFFNSRQYRSRWPAVWSVSNKGSTSELYKFQNFQKNKGGKTGSKTEGPTKSV